MKLTVKALALLASISFLGGCAHSIQITPKVENLKAETVSQKIEKNVGYYIPAEDLQKEVITPGGGGDKVKYKPYSQTEPAMIVMLSQVFEKVHTVKDLNDSAYIADKQISYIFKPSIKTNSSSESAFTWPPTSFTFELSCTALNPEGSEIWSDTVITTGKAEFEEFINDHGLSAKRASEQAFKKMMQKIAEAEKLQ